MVHGIVGKSAGFQQCSGPVKIISHIIRAVGVRADGEKFSAQLPIPVQDILTGIGMAQSIVKSPGVTFQRFALLD